MAAKEDEPRTDEQNNTADKAEAEDMKSQDNIDETSDNEAEVKLPDEQLPASREEEIKNIGIIQHLTRVGENLQKIYELDVEELSEEQKEDVYNKYLDILQEDIEMILEQKKGYEEELPPNVVNITKPIDDNMLKVMDQCLSVINVYMNFINEEEERDIEPIGDTFDTLEQTAYLLDETEDMLREVFESVETTGGIIGEA